MEENNRLTKQEMDRYSRHLLLPEVGIEGQEKIKKAKALIIGAGGLGSSAALYLAAAGVGTIGLVDFDKVEENNLQRQIIHSTRGIGKSKLESAKKSIIGLNPNINVNLHNVKLDSKNTLEIIKNYDIVIDGTDNFPARYLVNDACILLNKPNVYGSIFRFDGQSSVFNYKNGPCYRCLFPNPPPQGLVPSCVEAGVLGVLPGVIGTIQATEALKIILGKGDILSGRLLVYNALSMSFKELKLGKNKNCLICSDEPKIKELVDYEQFCGVKENDNKKITVDELKEMIDNKDDFVLVDVREKIEHGISNINDSILVPLSQIKNKDFGELEKFKDKKIVIYCRTDLRSNIAIDILKNNGFKDLVYVVGGMEAWKDIDSGILVG
ncbi:molybdenum cofactor biosynthesis protein MoeB [archaeon]|jgi:adenylyltransferase/sulfurtransferase|nr:molybdenum cofactor biosynthesis protein MoeB [archaeon]MDP6547401.1 molybdopterin-synthase adenylyltransferase MoeB [Candidatus Woesearchaeota archaeon]|tara:strand:- start:11852 stop:12994 length:1143 start_codon:yes stop_codon:yes gene_type:complete